MTTTTTLREALDTFVPPLRGFGRIALLGGSFNPPHIAHVMMALSVYATEDIDHVWVIPTADHAFGKKLAPFVDRVRMCHLAFRHLAGGAAIVDIESRLPGPSFTVQTLRALHEVRPGIRPVWIAGSDVLSELDRWREPEELKKLSRLVVVPRQGYPVKQSSALTQGRLQAELPMVSSSDVRERLERGADVSGLVDRLVLEYIERQKLYGADRGEPSATPTE